ncbi:MAG: F0F1 ATP synthase subunit A [Eubacteriales bacterium]|nr:F0F1 ATP synthase subunit A [Eubacteriales bacterium]MDD3350591.1 F0F1 ATP synthase subunit A [Eubacteriales bacterium]
MSLGPEVVFEFEFLDRTFGVTGSIVTQWVIMALLMVVILIVSRNITKIPSKRQSVLEMIVSMFSNLINANMGPSYKRQFLPYIGALGIYMASMNLCGLVGIPPATRDLNVTATFAALTFFLINANAISHLGVGGYIKGYFKPFPFMLPMNIIEKFTVPLSLCLRLYLNMLVGTMILELVYHGLGHFAFLIPVPLHFFFDLFVGLIQTFVFAMLTMVFVKTATEH